MNYIDYQSFASRIRSNGSSVTKLDFSYSIADTRCWSAIVNQGTDNIIVNFVTNRYQLGNQYFDILTSNKVITDIYTDDIYDVITSITKKAAPETVYFNNENVE